MRAHAMHRKALFIRQVTINNLVPSSGIRTTDHVDYINNPLKKHFGYTGYASAVQ